MRFQLSSRQMRNILWKKVFLWGLAASLLLGQGCRAQSSSGGLAPTLTAQATLLNRPASPVPRTPIPTPVVAQLRDATPASTTSTGKTLPGALSASEPSLTSQPTLGIPSPAPDPLTFAFPAAGANPVSNWRPPLYPVPWEPTPYDHFFFTRPIGANEVNWPLARYRYGGIFYAEPHTGIDIPAPKGTPVLAAGSGKVVWSGYGLYLVSDIYRDPYGIAVAIQHDFGYKGQALYTVYGHLDETYVWRSQRVEAGEVIGKVGETGKVSGPHLHFEVRLGDNMFTRTENPELWISPPQGWGILVGRVTDTDGDLMLRAKVDLQNEDTRQLFSVMTYAEGAVNSDPYYRENVVLGDLPAGNYSIWIDTENTTRRDEVKIEPGRIAYFKFDSQDGFDFSPPPTPIGYGFTPPDTTSTPLP